MKFTKKMNIDLITIDFWNTLFDSSAGKLRNAYRQRVLIDQIDKQGIVVMGKQFGEAMEETWKYFEKVWIGEQRTPSSQDCVEFVYDYLNVKRDDEAIAIVKSAFEDSVLVHPPKLMPNAKSVLKELSQNYSLAIISDTGFSPGSILKELMDREGILEYFSAFSFSDETGVSKPKSKAFQLPIDAMKTSAEKSLHIGDIEQTDIDGAKDYGMKAIRFSGAVMDFVNITNPDDTRADYQCANWNEIAELLKK